MKTLKLIITTLTAIYFLSCGQNSNGDNSYIAKGGNGDTFYSPSIDTLKTNRWNFQKYLNDPKTPAVVKDIFNNKGKLADDELVEYLERIHGEDKEARPFYFRVVTNSYKQADGAYTEGLGNAGYEYVKNYPEEFSNYFVGQDAFSDKDLQTWADIVMLEFQMISENEYEKPLVEDYMDTVKKNCNDCSVHQKESIEKFGRYLKERWTEVLRHIDT